MITPLMWKSLDTYSKCSAYLWTTPLEWDPPTKKFIFHPLFSRKLIPWFIVNYVVLPPLGALVASFAAAPFIGLNKLPFVNYVVILGYGVMLAFIFVGEFVGLYFAELIAINMNCVLDFYKSLQNGN